MEKEYEEINYWGNLEEVVAYLINDKNMGKLTCTNFNGTMLYSDTVTLDGAYKQATGKTYVEYVKQKREWLEKSRREDEEHKAKIPELTEYWKKKGREILEEDRIELWDKIVPVRLNDLYKGWELGCCLDIIKTLNNGGTFAEAKRIMNDQNHSGMSWALTKSMVKELCSRGEEFAKYIN